MAGFIGDLAVCAGVALAVWGLILLHRSHGPDSTAWLRCAGWLALVAGIGGAICTATDLFKYRMQGDFDHAYPPMMMKAMGGGMGGMGMMGRSDNEAASGPMKEKAMSPAPPVKPDAEPLALPPANDDRHELHHPSFNSPGPGTPWDGVYICINDDLPTLHQGGLSALSGEIA